MRLLRLDEVVQIAGIGKTSVYKLIGEGAFPRAVNIRGRMVRWVSDEIDAWIGAKIKERDQDSAASFEEGGCTLRDS